MVASEVRSLAQRSAHAAKDIKELIDRSNGEVNEGVELVNKAGTALDDIVTSIKKLAGGEAAAYEPGGRPKAVSLGNAA